MINDYSKDANGRRNGVTRVNKVLADLYEERDNLLKKIEMTRLIMRHIELTEGYTTTILKHMKKKDVVDFVQASLSSDCVKVAADNPAFVKALFNGLIHHKINDKWHEFFNVFSMSMISIENIENLLFDLMKSEDSAVKSLDNYKVIDTLVQHSLDELDRMNDFKVSVGTAKSFVLAE